MSRTWSWSLDANRQPQYLVVPLQFGVEAGATGPMRRLSARSIGSCHPTIQIVAHADHDTVAPICRGRTVTPAPVRVATPGGRGGSPAPSVRRVRWRHGTRRGDDPGRAAGRDVRWVVREVSSPRASDATIAELSELWLEYGLLVFPGQHLTQHEQDAFARRFGDLEFTATPLTNIQRDGTLRSTDHDLSKSLRGNERWHHDSTYMPVQATGAVFTAEIVPDEGGDTGFADMRAAYDALDDATGSGSVVSPRITPVATAWTARTCT